MPMHVVINSQTYKFPRCVFTGQCKNTLLQESCSFNVFQRIPSFPLNLNLQQMCPAECTANGQNTSSLRDIVH